MEIDDGVLRIVPSSRIDYNVILMLKCQLAAVYGLEKKVKAMKSKLQDWEGQAERTTMSLALFDWVIMIIRLLLATLNFRAPSSVTVYKELQGMCTVVWVVGSVIAVFKLMTILNLAWGFRGKMNDLRSNAIILQGLVEEDFRTNEGARCFFMYSHALFQISFVFMDIDFCNYDLKWMGVLTIGALLFLPSFALYYDEDVFFPVKF